MNLISMGMLDNITGKLLQLIDWLESSVHKYEIILENEQQANAIYTALGICTSLILAATFFYWAAPAGVSYWPFLESLSLACYLHLFIWILVHKGEPYSRALLISLFSLVPISLIAPAAGPVALGILNALFLFYVIYKKAPAFLQSTRNIQFVAIFATLFALVIFAATSADVGDAFVAEKFRQLTLDPNTLFQSALATMVKNYMAISTGLNGLERLQYPVLSNFLYARVANIMNIRVYEVYGLTNFIVFGPLMILSWIRFCGEMTARAGQFILLTTLLLTLVVLDRCFGWQTQDYFSDASYLIGLVLLPGFLSALAPIARKDGQNQLRNWFTLWLYLPFLSLSQEPLGFACFVITVYFLLVRSLYSWGSRLGYLIPTVVLWYLGDYGARSASQEIKLQWGALQDKLGDPNILHFFVSQFAYVFLLLPVVLYKPIRALLTRELRIWVEFFFILGVLAIIGSQTAGGDREYYLANLHLFFTLPVLLMIFSASDFRPRFSAESHPFVFNYYRVIVTFLFVAGIFYLAHVVPADYEQTEQIKKAVLANTGYDSKYFKLFQLIHDDPEEAYLVYVPKSESGFWNNTDDHSRWAASQCAKMPLFMIAATGKPAIFGLPDPDQHCERNRFGYEAYDDSDAKESAVTDVADARELCKTVLSKGFRGFYRVTLAAGVTKERCR